MVSRVLLAAPIPRPRRDGPRPVKPVLARPLRAFTERHHLTPPPEVRPPPRVFPRRRMPPVDLAPAPVLRRLTPPPPPIPRFRLVSQPAPAPAYLPPPAYGPATTVGILATGGTRIVSMKPADLTLPGRVDITDFSITLFAGVW